MNTINEELFGRDPKVLKAINFAKNIACTKVPVLITGEVGIGKKTLGHYIHNQSSRKQKPIMVVDCSEDQQTIEKKILGHRDEETGKYSKGILEKSNGGTVILSNIDGLDEEFQKKIFKIFQELTDYEIDIRLVVTTTKNLSKLVAVGRFYRALYMYFSGTQIHLPPLRERREDIQYLGHMLLNQYAKEKNLDTPEITQDALDKIMSYYWTHNMIELMSVIENSLNNCQDGTIHLSNLAIGERKIISSLIESDDDGFKLMSLKEAERLLIRKALIHTSENRTQAAKILGVSIRTLRNKINEYRTEGANYFINLR